MDGEWALTQGMIDAKMRPGGRIVWTRDATANDSDKTYTVPAGKIWELKYIGVDFRATATVGTRKVFVGIGTAINILYWTSQATNAVLAASKEAVFTYLFGNAGGIINVTAAFQLLFDGSAVTDIDGSAWGAPTMLLPGGTIIRVYDFAAIDAAADDMIVVLNYIEYDA